MILGDFILEHLGPHLEELAPYMPGEIFPLYFSWEYFQRPLIAAIFIALVAGFLGSFLLVKNLALIGDGLGHVAFGAIGVGVVVGGLAPIWFAVIACVFAAIIIDILQEKKWLTGDASIAIFMTGFLGLGLVTLRLYGNQSQVKVESYLWGDLNLLSSINFEFILWVSIISYLLMIVFYNWLLSIVIDPIAALVQGLRVRIIGLIFSIMSAVVVVAMVQIIGVLLVTALLVTPAATAQLVGRSFAGCVILAQIFAVAIILLGLYLSAENSTGTGEMTALVSALVFAIVAIIKLTVVKIITPMQNNN